MTDMTDHTTETAHDFDGCNRECRKAGKHTLRWGGCERAPRPEPTVSMSKVYTDTDGYPSIGYDSYTVPELGELIAAGLRASDLPVDGDDLVDVGLVAARAIVHRNDPAAPAVVPSADRSALPAPADDLATARATNQRLNLRTQALESELAAYRRAVGQWEINERGTYIPHSSLRTIGLASGKDILGSVRHLRHFERVEQAEAAIEDHRLALSVVLGLGTGAPWDAIHDRATELAGQPAGADRAAVLTEAADALVAKYGISNRAAAELRRMAAEASGVGVQAEGRGDCPVCDREYKLTAAGRLPRHVAHVPDHAATDGIYCRGTGELRRLAGEAAPDNTETQQREPVRHAPGKVVLCSDCRAKGHSVCMGAL